MALKEIAIHVKATGVERTAAGMKTVENAANSMGRGNTNVTRQAEANASRVSNAVGNTATATGAAAAGMENMLARGAASVMRFIGTASLIAAPFIAAFAAIKFGISVMDDFQVSIIQIAAQLTQLQGPKDVAKSFQDSMLYATALAGKLEEIDANSFANNKGLMAMLQTMTMQGVVLDVNNMKQVESFTSLSNAIAMYTAGQDQAVQARQEMRALMTGEVNQNSQLSRIMDAQIKQEGIYKDGLKEVVALGQQHGDTLERLSPYLVGVNAASESINKTWSAASSSMETAVNKITREGFADAFKTIVPLVSEMGTQLKNSSLVSEVINKTWLACKGVVSAVVDILRGPMWVVLAGIGGLVSKIFDGWGLLLSSVLPVLADEFKHLISLLNAMVNMGMGFGLVMLDAVGAVGSAITSVGKAAFQALTGDFEAAGKTLQGMFSGVFVERFKDNMMLVKGTAIAITEEWRAMQDPMGRMLDKADQYLAKSKQTKVTATAPAGGAGGKAEDGKKAAEEAARDYAKEALDVQETMTAAWEGEQRLRAERAQTAGQLEIQLKEQQGLHREALALQIEMENASLREKGIYEGQVKGLKDKLDVIRLANVGQQEALDLAAEVARIADDNIALQTSLIDDPGARYQQQLTDRYNADKAYLDKTLAATRGNAAQQATIQERLADLKQKLDKDTAAAARAQFEKQLATASAYTSTAGQLFSALADTQDQSSRAGFESAKDYNLAAVVMNTATAIMAQLSIPGPVGWAGAAAATLMGAINYARVDGTEYGGGGGAIASGGSFSGSASGGGSGEAGSSRGRAYTSVQDSQTLASMQRLADSVDNASLAMRKVSDGLTEFSGMLSGDYNQSALGNADGRYAALGSENGPMGNLLAGMKTSITGAWKLSMDLFKDGSAYFSKTAQMLGLSTFFGLGNKWAVTGSGVSLGLSGGELAGQAYTEKTKKGGWLTSDKKRTSFSELSDGFSYMLTGALQRIASNTNLAATIMGTSTRLGGVNIPQAKIATAGRSSEDIQKDVEAWLQQVGNEFAKTVDGLAAFAAPGEEAYAALIRLATGLQGVNEQFALIGQTLLSSTLQGADYASRLIDLMGGAEAFSDSMEGYFTGMFTQAEQDAALAAQATRQVTAAFNDMGRSVPATRQEFVSLVNSLDLTSESGATLFAALMEIAPAFAEAAAQASALAAAQESLNQDAQARIWRLTEGSEALADLYELQIAQRAEMTAATEKGLNVTTLAVAQQLEWADAVKSATAVMAEAQKKLVEATKSALTDAISTAQTLLGTLKSLLSGPAALLSPEAAYRQAQDQFASADAGNGSERIMAFIDASMKYNASGPQYQADYQAALAKAGALAETAPTLSFVEQQIKLLAEISRAVTDGNAATVAALGVTYNAAQIDMGTAKNALSIALQGIQAVLNTPITDGTAKADLQAQIELLQSSLNTGVTGTARTAISEQIAALQTSLNTGVLDGTAKTAINQQIALLQGELNTGVTGTARTAITEQIAALQTSLNTGVLDGTAKTAINYQIALLQEQLNTGVTGTARTAITEQIAALQTSLNTGVLDGTAKTAINQQIALLQEQLNTGVTGTARTAITEQIAALQTSLNTGVLDGTAKTAINYQIALLQVQLNAPVTGTAKDAINSSIGLLQLALDGTITSATAQQGIATAYALVQGALNGTISGTVAATALSTQYAITQAALNGTITSATATQSLDTVYATVQGALNGTISSTLASASLSNQYAIVQGALNGTITGDLAARALSTQYAITQAALNGAITSATATQAIGVVYGNVQGVLNGSITSAAATTAIGATYESVQGVLNGTISSATATAAISSQYGLVTSALGTGLNNGDTSISGLLATFNKAITEAAQKTSDGLMKFINALGLVDSFTQARGAYDASVAEAAGQYKAGAISPETFTQQVSSAYSALQTANNNAIAGGVTSLTMPTRYAASESDNALRMQAKASVIKDYALRAAVGLEPYRAEYDITPLNAAGKSTPNGVLDVSDAQMWLQVASGQRSWSSLGLPVFAAGGITSGPSIAGEGMYREAVVPLPDGRSIPVHLKNNSADNRDTLRELKEQNRQLAEQNRHLAALVQLSRAGFNQVVEQGEQGNRHSAEIANKTTLARVRA